MQRVMRRVSPQELVVKIYSYTAFRFGIFFGLHFDSLFVDAHGKFRERHGAARLVGWTWQPYWSWAATVVQTWLLHLLVGCLGCRLQLVCRDALVLSRFRVWLELTRGSTVLYIHSN